MPFTQRLRPRRMPSAQRSVLPRYRRPRTPRTSRDRVSRSVHGSKAYSTRPLTKSTFTYYYEQPPAFEYHALEGVERLEKYRPGGYHPIHIHDVLGKRHQVVHKLGYGGYSTTWLCRDNESGRYVAAKVGTAYSNPCEGEIMAFLNEDCTDTAEHLGRTMIPPVQDQFIIQGPNGNHACYTTVPALCSLSDAKDGSYKRLFQLETARSIVAQLVLAVDYVHRRGVVHGDIHLGNIFLKISPEFQGLSTPELYEEYGAPFVKSVTRLDGKPLRSNVPHTATPPVWLGKASEDFIASEVKVVLKDFGEAYSPHAHLRDFSNTITSFRPPEALFEEVKGLSYPSDIWTLGCAIWSIIGQQNLFESDECCQDTITAGQVDTLEDFPVQWWKKWTAKHEYFRDVGVPTEGRRIESWEEYFQNHIQGPRREAGLLGFDAEEKAAVMDMLQRMIVFRPENRWNTGQILECEWMEKWAMPEFERSIIGGLVRRLSI